LTTTNAERRVPPHPRGVVELLRRAGHTVVVREKAHSTGLAYKLNDERWRNALQLSNRARRLGVM
jgi:alanine dehydrogenase